MPKVSVLTPCYNSARFIEAAIASVLDQTFEDFELILCDDGSSDNTWQQLEHFSKLDSRIRILKNPTNKGISYTRNVLTSEASGEYIAFLDSDDQMYPDRLEMQVEFLDSHPEIDVIGSNYQEFDSSRLRRISRVKIAHDAIVKAFKYMCPIPNPTLMARKKVFNTIQFSQDLTSAEDLDFLLRAMEQGCKFANLPYVTTLYRVHGNSETSMGKFPMQLNTYLAFQNHNGRIQHKNTAPEIFLKLKQRCQNSLYIRYSASRNLTALEQFKCLLVSPFSRIGQFFLIRRIYRTILE